MTKKHFIQIAKALLAQRPGNAAHAMTQWLCCVNAIADVCAQTNPLFDRARFLAACGVA